MKNVTLSKHLNYDTGGLFKKSKNGGGYSVDIQYTVIDTNNPNYNHESHCSISIESKEEAQALYNEIIRQYREQDPDPQLVNDLVGKYLLDNK